MSTLQVTNDLKPEVPETQSLESLALSAIINFEDHSGTRFVQKLNGVQRLAMRYLSCASFDSKNSKNAKVIQKSKEMDSRVTKSDLPAPKVLKIAKLTPNLSLQHVKDFVSSNNQDFVNSKTIFTVKLNLEHIRQF